MSFRRTPAPSPERSQPAEARHCLTDKVLFWIYFLDRETCQPVFSFFILENICHTKILNGKPPPPRGLGIHFLSLDPRPRSLCGLGEVPHDGGGPPRNDTVAGASRRKAVASATVPRPGQTTNKDGRRWLQPPFPFRSRVRDDLRRFQPPVRSWTGCLNRWLKPPDIVNLYPRIWVTVAEATAFSLLFSGQISFPNWCPIHPPRNFSSGPGGA